MKLMTKALEKRFAQIGSQENSTDPLIIAKFFNPCGGQTWYATEFFSDKMFFGYVSLFGDHNDEWGYFSLEEMQQFRGNLGLGLERDLHFQECLASTIIGKDK